MNSAKTCKAGLVFFLSLPGAALAQAAAQDQTKLLNELYATEAFKRKYPVVSSRKVPAVTNRILPSAMPACESAGPGLRSEGEVTPAPEGIKGCAVGFAGSKLMISFLNDELLNSVASALDPNEYQKGLVPDEISELGKVIKATKKSPPLFSSYKAKSLRDKLQAMHEATCPSKLSSTEKAFVERAVLCSIRGQMTPESVQAIEKYQTKEFTAYSMIRSGKKNIARFFGTGTHLECGGPTHACLDYVRELKLIQ